MYRAIILVTLLGLLISEGDTRCKHHCKTRKYRGLNEYPKHLFKKVAANIESADKTINKYCAKNEIFTNVFYDKDYFKLTVHLQEYIQDDILVMFRHRVLFIDAMHLSRTESNITFADIKILPDIVEPRLATWTFVNKELKILVPYKEQTSCGSKVIDNVSIRVPRADETPDEKTKIEEGYGKEDEVTTDTNEAEDSSEQRPQTSYSAVPEASRVLIYEAASQINQSETKNPI